MTSDDLTPKQCEALKAEFGRMLRYVSRISKRMQKRRFPPDDPLVTKTGKAYSAAYDLHNKHTI